MLTTVMIIKTRALEAPQKSIRLRWLSLVIILVGPPPLPVLSQLLWKMMTGPQAPVLGSVSLDREAGVSRDLSQSQGSAGRSLPADTRAIRV